MLNDRSTIIMLAQCLIIFILVANQMDPETPEPFFQISKDSDFSLQNIPFGVIALKTQPSIKFPATRVGDWVINLRKVESQGLFNGELLAPLKGTVFQSEVLNDFMGLSRQHWREARRTLQALLCKGSPLANNEALKKEVMHRVSETVNQLPARIGDYTDFYSSRSHAFNVGSIIRGPANALNQNWLHIPIGYHGRSSSIVTSGTPLCRPRGQVKAKDAQKPSFSECKRLDFEIQVGTFLGGRCNDLGHPIKVNDAWEYVFGFVLLNDWSFRDFQTWEYVPLGPFTAKNGMSTISPWIVTLDALQGSEVELPKQQPEPLEYLREKKHMSFDIFLELSIRTNKMDKYERLVSTNFKHMYWSFTQQLAHHSVAGCNMRPGDLLGSGTISGNEKHEFGSLLELTWGGQNPIVLSNGHSMKFLEDGDSINLQGHTLVAGSKVGFGDCEGTVLPALPQSSYI